MDNLRAANPECGSRYAPRVGDMPHAMSRRFVSLLTLSEWAAGPHLRRSSMWLS
jgi:hypothetical protein